MNGKIIALRSYHGKYVVAEKSGLANANRGRVGAWEKFKVEQVGCGSEIALKSVAHNKYLVATSNGYVNANSGIRGSSETFRLFKVSDFRIALRSVHGKYVVAEKDGRLNANRDRRRSFETFIFDYPQGKFNCFNLLALKEVDLRHL